jgi:protocatechuate 3,4-dioxygenase beta subunit
MVGRIPVAIETLELRRLLSGGMISGTIFNDVNGNSAHDSSEPGLSGATAYLDINRNGKLDAGEPSRVTSSSGAFNFSNVAPAAYSVREILPSGLNYTTLNEFSATVTEGSSATINFGNQKAGSISGLVFNDSNADGLIDGFDSGISNATVYIDANNNGKLDTGEKSMKSANNGPFNFFNLAPGTYTVREIPATRFRLTTTGVRTVVVTTGPAPAITFGNQMLSLITGTVYNDVNASSGLDAGEPHLPNVKLFLDANQNGILDAGEVSTTSAADGTYTFTNLIPGTYRVTEVVPGGFVTGDPVAGHTDVTLTAQENWTANIGNFKPGTAPVSFSGTVFKDLNLNAAKDANEPGLAGWKFYLDLNNNNVFDTGEPTAVSNSAGLYTFKNVKTGRYLIKPVTIPTGWRMSHFVAWFATSFGNNVTGLDFAASQTAKVFGTVFIDQNANATLDTYEFHLGGWTVYLDANNNGKLDAGEKSVVTSGTGNYSFDGLAPGTYVVRIVPQAGYVQTTPGFYKLTLTSGQVVGNENFGE